MKNSSDTIGSRTSELPGFSVVPQPAVPPRVQWIKHWGLFRTHYIDSYVSTLRLELQKVQNYNWKLNSKRNKTRIWTVLAVICLRGAYYLDGSGCDLSAGCLLFRHSATDLRKSVGVTRIKNQEIFKYKSLGLSLELIRIFSCRCSTSLRAGRSGLRNPVEARFPGPLQIGPAAHPSSCTSSAGLSEG
jgi:hypothetical protein